jgi:probable DNA metabolism protein
MKKQGEKQGDLFDTESAESLALSEAPELSEQRLWREFDRLRGLLRFKPEKDGRYTARCAPDGFVLPLLAEHFAQRFGGIPWAVIDEKRGLFLACDPGGIPRMGRLSGQVQDGDDGDDGDGGAGDNWEDLWRNYFRSVNNESRNNPKLQKQFMPERYRKYLVELE